MVNYTLSLEMTELTSFFCWWSTTHVCNDSLVAVCTTTGSVCSIPVTHKVNNLLPDNLIGVYIQIRSEPNTKFVHSCC